MNFYYFQGCCRQINGGLRSRVFIGQVIWDYFFCILFMIILIVGLQKGGWMGVFCLGIEVVLFDLEWCWWFYFIVKLGLKVYMLVFLSLRSGECEWGCVGFFGFFGSIWQNCFQVCVGVELLGLVIFFYFSVIVFCFCYFEGFKFYKMRFVVLVFDDEEGVFIFIEGESFNGCYGIVINIIYL